MRFLLFLLSLLSAIGYAQESSLYLISDFNKNICLQFGVGGVVTKSFSSYGKMLYRQSKESDVVNRYGYQGQELENDLQLILFPYRLYDLQNCRFFQPDPKSQYISPYLFVGADPVNFIDIDGKEGKALVLYEEYLDEHFGINESMYDLVETVNDAYYVPLSKFMNGEVGDLSEWNGNVFIKAHMSGDVTGEIEVENASKAEMLRSRANNVLRIDEPVFGKYRNYVDAEALGGTLRRFSESRGVPIKSIVAGGCEGGYSAERIGLGYMNEGERTVGRELQTMGLKPGRNAMLTGSHATSFGGKMKGMPKTRYQVRPQVAKVMGETEVEEFENGQEIETFDRYVGQLKNGFVFELNYIEGKEDLTNLVNGRLPNKLEPEMLKFNFKY